MHSKVFILILIFIPIAFQNCGDDAPDFYNCLDGINENEFPYTEINDSKSVFCDGCIGIGGSCASATIFFDNDKSFELRIRDVFCSPISTNPSEVKGFNEIRELIEALPKREIILRGSWEYEQNVHEIPVVVSGPCSSSTTWRSDDCVIVDSNSMSGVCTLNASNSNIPLIDNQINGTYSISCAWSERSHKLNFEIRFINNYTLFVYFGKNEVFDILK
jgi:hypothetical protein